MTQMFFNAVQGIQKRPQGYVFTDFPHVNPIYREIPEVVIIHRYAELLGDTQTQPIRLKICVTGPYTLSTLFALQDETLITVLGELVQKILEANVYSTHNCQVAMVTLDEPVFGMIDDPLLDYGSCGRDALIAAWHQIFQTAKSRNIQTCLHLHNTSNSLFWHVSSLDIIESHVDDPLYTSPLTSTLLNQTDKFLKASIAVTNFDTLLHRYFHNQPSVPENALSSRIAATWRKLMSRQESPTAYLESVTTMRHRLHSIIDRFSIERVPFAGPECGLKSFPTYAAGIECLRRTIKATKRITQ
jgi:methionine synthase II (cobalamin-independent)